MQDGEGMAPSRIKQAKPMSARRNRRQPMATVALIVLIGLIGSAVAVAQAGHALRIVGRHLEDGRFEVALQQRNETDEWGERILPAQRFMHARSAPGRWLASSPVTIDAEHGALEVRIAARRLADGRVEVALQEARGRGAWGDRILPQRRFVGADAAATRWHAGSAVLTSPPGLPDEATTIEIGPSADEATTIESGPPTQTLNSGPRALMSPTGVPVAVVGQDENGYLVRTPCGNTVELAGGEPIEGVQVVIDPGHGGRFEVGAVGPNGLPEDVLNLTLSRAILAKLADRGIAAATTRTGDYGSLLSVRAGFADALGADALISIHHNAPTPAPSRSPGTEVYVQSTDDATPRPDSARLGGLLYEEITAALATFEDVNWSRLPNAGVLRVLFPWGGDAYGMIRRPATPAVLMEYGYLSNPSEAALFATDEYISVAAVATANAIEAYLDTDRPGTGFVERPRRFDPAPAPSRCAEVRLD